MDDALAIDADVLVNGQKLVDKQLAHVDQVLVDEDMHRPAMFTMTLLDPDRDVVKQTGLRSGARVEIAITGEGAIGDGKLLIGEVVSVECDYDEVETQVIVRGYAASHRLHRGRRTRVFKDATDSDMIRSVAGEAGLDVGEIDPTQEVHEHVTQANLTDWEFLTNRARPLGLDLIVTDGRLDLTRRQTADEAPSAASAEADTDGLDPRHLIYNYNLTKFHGRISAAEQVANVEVRGWNRDRKEAVVGTAKAGTGAAGLDVTDPVKLAGLFADPSFVDVISPVSNENEASGIATAIAERIGSAFAEVDGEAVGNTALRAGVAVRVSGVNDDFNGAYVLSHVRHVINREGYRTQFSVSGHHDRSLLGLISASSNGNGQHGSTGRVPATLGLVRGIVSENADPEKLGRVKVKLPWLHEEFSSAWAPVVQLGAGPDSGTFFLPAVQDEVLVGFEHGNIDRPIVVGGLFNGLDKPPAYAQYLDDGKVVGRAIVSRHGHEITFHDADDTEGIIVSAVDGDRRSVVSIGLNGKEEKLVIHSTGNIDLDADGDITVKAAGELVLQGAKIKLN